MTRNKLRHLALSENGFLFDPSTGHTYSLNRIGTFVLKKLIQGLSQEQIGALMLEEYEAPEQVILKDLDQFLHFLLELGVIERQGQGEGWENGKEEPEHCG